MTKMAVTLEELKQHLRVEHDADDALIQSYGLAATEFAEQVCDREIVKDTDPQAFVTVAEASQVYGYGNGFYAITGDE